MIHADQATKCECCKSILPVDDDGETFGVRIQRGWFVCEEEKARGIEDNPELTLYICETCYMEDPDLCAFFNRIGRQYR